MLLPTSRTVVWIDVDLAQERAVAYSLSPSPCTPTPIPTSPALHGALVSIYVVNPVLVSKLCQNPPEQLPLGHLMCTGQCCQLSKLRAIWGDNLRSCVPKYSTEWGVCSGWSFPLAPRTPHLEEGVQLEKDQRSRLGAMLYMGRPGTCSTG